MLAKENNNFHGNDEIGVPKGMKIPDGYFQAFEAKIWTDIKAENSKIVELNHSSKRNPWINKVALAASLVIGFFVIATNSFQSSNTDISILAESVVNEVEYYEIDDYLLAENFTMEELESISFTEEYVTSDEIMDYILEENYSEYTIIENL